MSRGIEIFAGLDRPLKLIHISGRALMFLAALFFLRFECFLIFASICLLDLLPARPGQSSVQLNWFLLGLLTPLIGVFQSELFIFCSIWLLFSAAHFDRRFLASLPFLMMLSLSFLISVFLEAGNYHFLLDLLTGDSGFWLGYLQLSQASREYSFPGTAQFFEILRYFIFFALIFSAGSRLQQARISYFKGFLPGSCIALLITALEILWPGLLELGNTSAYWQSIGRNSGTLSDPNAFGLFAFLMLPISHWAFCSSKSKWRWAYLVQGFFWITLAPFSGSRSFFLGCSLYIIFALCFSRYRKYLFVFGILAALIIVSDIPSVLASSFPALPIGLRRTISAFDLSALAETFQSRLIFWKIAVAVWRDHILFGVGPSNFPLAVVSYAQQLGLGTQFWVDNANSYYLGVLAELGLCGAVLLLIALSPVRIDKATNDSYFSALIYLPTLITVLILLLLGPHLDFIEILLPFLLFIKPLFTFSNIQLNFRFFTVLCVSMILSARIFHDFSSVSIGLYHWERDQDLFVRWIRPESKFFVVCENGLAEISLKVPKPAIHKEPVTILIESPYAGTKSLRIADHKVHRVSFSCVPEIGSVLSPFFAGSNLVFRIRMSSGFMPHLKSKESKDFRLLGAQLIDSSSLRVF